ncbi:preprotein translocase subunit Sec61beta [Candidatus Woesearchaeota archaeon]|nr:preprotein translocase subunit Sec61beta [Candidatus Woesearchaeota archaeon]
MAEDRVSMPQSGGGLMRYFDDYKSRIQVNKTWVIIAIVLVIVIELILQKGI